MEIRRLLLLAQLPLWLGFGAAYFAVEEAVNRRVHIVGQATQTRVQTAQLADLLQLMVDMETGVRGYVLAGHEEFLGPYRAGREQLGATMAQLYNRTEHLPFPELARRDLQRIDSLSSRWVVEIAEPEIRARVEGWSLNYFGIPLRQITVSQGVASWRRGATPASLSKEADQALYRAKGEGRNRGALADLPTPVSK